MSNEIQKDVVQDEQVSKQGLQNWSFFDDPEYPGSVHWSRINSRMFRAGCRKSCKSILGNYRLLESYNKRRLTICRDWTRVDKYLVAILIADIPSGTICFPSTVLGMCYFA